MFRLLTPVVQTLDSVIRHKNHYSMHVTQYPTTLVSNSFNFPYPPPSPHPPPPLSSRMSVIWSWNNLFTDIPTLPICCVSPTLLIFIYSLDLSWNSEKKKNNWWYISSIFLFLRSESKRLHITFGSHTMSYRTTQKLMMSKWSKKHLREPKYANF